MGDGSAGRYHLPGKHEDLSPITRTPPPKKRGVQTCIQTHAHTHRKVHTELLFELMV